MSPPPRASRLLEYSVTLLDILNYILLPYFIFVCFRGGNISRVYGGLIGGFSFFPLRDVAL